MVTCKDCLHNHVCALWRAQAGQDAKSWSDSDDWDCDYFADKSRFIELPCKVGDVVYFLLPDGDCETYVDVGAVFAIGVDALHTMWISARYESGLKYYHTSEDFGKTVFLTREEAEAALAERMKENG